MLLLYQGEDVRKKQKMKKMTGILDIYIYCKLKLSLYVGI